MSIIHKNRILILIDKNRNITSLFPHFSTKEDIGVFFLLRNDVLRRKA